MPISRIRLIASTAAVALAASLLAACGSDSAAGASADTGSDTGSDTSSNSHESTDTPSDGSADQSGAESKDAGENAAENTGKNTGGTINIPIAAGWAEDVVVSHLWKYALEKRGYTVELSTLDIGPIFTGVAGGDYDLFFDTSLPTTHADYWAEYGDQVVDFGPWYDKEQNTIAVPDYMDVDSLADLKSIGDKVDKTIIGIDPGAGLTRVTKTQMMPAYGLTDAGWTLKTSSTAAMLAELKSSIEAEEPVVVTLWHPHWAYNVFPIKDLADPQGAMGAPDKLHAIGSKDFAATYPDLADAATNFHMDDDLLANLEKVVLQDYGDGKYAEGIAAWAKDHSDFVDSLLS